MSLETWELDPARFPSASGLAWQRGLKKAKIKLDLLTDSDMLLNDRKRYQRRNIVRYSSIYTSQQEL